MKPKHAELVQGENPEALRQFEDGRFSAVVTDPPYELGFMGRKWDRSGIAFRAELWEEVARVCRPGAYLLAFGGSRTFHRIACAIEDGGWEIRDTIVWLYGTGNPKTLDVSKAIDGHFGAKREVLGAGPYASRRPREDVPSLGVFSDGVGNRSSAMITKPATPEAEEWAGWGTALKPAWEPVIVARKPFDSTVAANVLEHGCGGMNIDGCRAPMRPGDGWNVPQPSFCSETGLIFNMKTGEGRDPSGARSVPHKAGRWPANVILDPEAACLLDRQAGDVSRFYYCTKADRPERDLGCQHLPARTGAQAVARKTGTAGLKNARAGAGRSAANVKNWHPTVKPLDLMRYLVRLVVPPGGTVLDPFAGSGTTIMAALLEGADAVGVELDPAHIQIAEARVEWARREVRGRLF